MGDRAWEVVALRLAILVVGVGLLTTQVVVLPLIASECADSYPEFAALQWPVLGLAVATLAAAETALLGVWKLLTLVSTGALFESTTADYWVRVEFGAFVAATSLIVVIDTVLSDAGANPPLGCAIFGGAIVVGVGCCMLILVLRQLLRQASAEHRELQSVI